MLGLENRPSELTQRLYGNLYKPQPGHFGLIKGDSVVWISCRDEMQRYRVRELLFATNRKANVIRFMKKIQDVIGLKNGDRLDVEGTADENIVRVRLPRFWQRNVSRSLVTALLRAGQHYARSYRSALKKVPYFNYTAYALDRFLGGFTKYRPRQFFGWQNTFDGMPKAAVRQCLVKEKKC